jgi:tRNA A-37 threonylcarbamoyl transferase component Bud32
MGPQLMSEVESRVEQALAGLGSVRNINELAGSTAFTSRLFEVEVDSNALPDTVVVKLEASDPATQFSAAALQLYAREVNFFRHAAESSPLRTPTCFAADLSDDGMTFHLVLERLVGDHMDQTGGVSGDEAVAVISEVARHHRFWAERDIPHGVSLPINNDLYLAVLPDVMDAGLAVAREQLDVSDAVVGLTGAVRDHFADVTGALIGPTPSLCHGDLRAENLFVLDNKFAFVDFQVGTLCDPVFDVAYFVTQSVDVDTVAGIERDLVRSWSDEAYAGDAQDFDDVWNRYRLATAFCVAYPLFAAAQGLEDSVRLAQAEQVFARLDRACHELDLESVVS